MAAPVNPVLRGGDAVFWWGTGFLSDSIKALTRGPSHISTVLPLDLPLPDGSAQKEVHLIESTILNGVNGVQINPLSKRLAEYDAGGACAAAPLAGRWRDFLDWENAWALAYRKLGNRYNIPEIAAYLANLVLPPELQIDAPRPNETVCSEFRAELLRAAGLPGLDPYRTPPRTLWRMRMYGPLAVYSGAVPAGDLRTFNTI